MAASRLISRPGLRVPRLLTVSRRPDKIASAPINIVHERAHESVRLHPASTTTTAFYASAFGGNAATSAAIYIHSHRVPNFASGFNADAHRAAPPSDLHAACGPAAEKKRHALGPGWLRLSHLDHYRDRHHRNGGLPRETEGRGF